MSTDKSETSSRRTRHILNSKDTSERKGKGRFRSLICDESGIIIGEMVYRCLLCSYINESMDKVRTHYQQEHVDIDDNVTEYNSLNGGYCPSPSNSYVENSGSTGPNIEDNGQEDGNRSSNNSDSLGPTTRSGCIMCKICSSLRSYSYVQRRFGQYTCSTCYRYFTKFLLNPRLYSCPSLGLCSLDVKNKCRACWLLACITIYDGKVDDDKQKIMKTYYPGKSLLGIDITDNEGIDAVEGDNMTEKEDKNFAKSSSQVASKKLLDDSLQNNQDDINDANCDNLSQNGSEASKNSIKSDSSRKVNKLLKKISKRKRLWSCMKCSNCLKQECGRCIYCLDRPKYGGQFRLRQRCAVRRCLLKLN